MIREILSEVQWQRLQTERQLDFCHYIPTAGRYRANVFVDQKGLNAVFRVIPERPPTIAEVGLPPHLAEIADYHQGLVLVCGPSGSGKSTTLAALVNLFNETRHDHVITLEDPVEFVHPFKNCLVNQREVGRDTQSFSRALRAALREDPDVIVIGEMRDPESVSLALTAAETGHIVLGTLNSTSGPKAVDRILSSFPVDEQGQVRAALSESLKYVIAQRLLPAKEARKQVAGFEVLKNTVAIANMIRDEKTYQIPSAMQIGRSQGMQTFDDALKTLLSAGRISPEAAYRAAAKKEDFEVAARPAPAGQPRRSRHRPRPPGETAAPVASRCGSAGDEEAVSEASVSITPKIDRFLRLMTSRGASDFHMTVGRPPMLRVSGTMEPIRYRTLSEADYLELMRPIVSDRLWEEYTSTGDADLSYEVPGVARFRVNLFRQQRGSGAVFRVIPTKIMTLEQLGLPEQVRKVAEFESGLVLVTGPDGLRQVDDAGGDRRPDQRDARTTTSSRSRTRSSSSTRTSAA